MVSGRKEVDISQSDIGRARDKKETEQKEKKKKRAGRSPTRWRALNPLTAPLSLHTLSRNTIPSLASAVFCASIFFSFFLFRGGRNEVQERLREAVREVSGRAEGCDG